MPFVRFPDLVHKTTVKLQNQLYSILSKYDLHDISNSNDHQFTNLKKFVLGTSLTVALLCLVINCERRKCEGENLIILVFIKLSNR